jgi:hypothetical protein
VDLGSREKAEGDGSSDSDSCQRNKDLHVGDFTDLERCGFSMHTEVGADEMTNNPVNQNGGCKI